MSLINQMLRDLESRRASLAGAAGMTQEVRSLPPQQEFLPRAGRRIGAVLAVLLLAAAAWWLFGGPSAETTQQPAVALGPRSVVAPPSQAPAPLAAQTVPAPAASEPAAPLQPAADMAAPMPPPPRLQTAAEPPVAKPRPQASAAGLVKPAPGRALAEKESGLKVETRLSSVPTVQGPVAADENRIEKKVRMLTPRERAENEYRRALGLVNQGRVQDGLAVLRGALSEDAGHAGARLVLFGLLVEQQRYEEARALLQEALVRDPAQPQFASRLARLQLEDGDVRGAEQTLSKAAAAAAGNAEFRAFHAAVLQRLTLHQEAVAEYQAALRLAPQVGTWWMGLAISLEADGRTAEAREAYLRAQATATLSTELAAFVEQKLRQLQ